MKKRFCAMLLVIIMVLQFIPVSAETVQNISTAEDLYALNNDLDANVILMNDIRLNIDDTFVQNNGAYIGSNANPFTGKIDGNGKTIYLNVDTDLSDWSIFYSMKDAEVTNLTIKLESFYSSSSSDKVSMSLLAHEIENCTIKTSFSIDSTLKTPFWGVQNGRDIDIGLAAIIAKNKNTISLGSSRLYGYGIPYHSDVRIGAIVEGISDSTLGYPKLSMSATSFLMNLPVSDNSYTGGAVAETNGQLSVTLSGDYQVIYSENTTNPFTASTKNQKTNVYLGSAVGEVGVDSSITFGGDYSLTLDSLGVADTLTVGAGVGINRGAVTARYLTSVVDINDTTGENIGFLDGFNSSNSVLTIGGVVGDSQKMVHIHSNGVNVMSENLDAKNAKLNFGTFLGAASGDSVRIDNNGVYFYSPEMKVGAGSSLGNMMGRDNGVGQLYIRYNIINATDKHSFKTDYSWIQNPIGNVAVGTTIPNFKYNYWAYMDYAILNVPTQIYFTFPMNYYGDNPPVETSPEYPFLATYSYLYQNQETNQYLTFQNANNSGIGTVLLTKDCVASVKVSFDIIDSHAEGIWGGHVYQNPDVLNRFGQGNSGNDNPGDDTSGDIWEGFDVPPPNPKPNGATLVDVYDYTNNINGQNWTCRRYEYSDGSWHENCIDETGKNGLTQEGQGQGPSDDEQNPPDDEDETVVLDPNHGNSDYTCSLEKRGDVWYETCIKNSPDYVYDKNHGKSGYTCWFDKIGDTYYETCEKDEPDYFYDRNHGRDGYTCWFERYGNDYYETCEKDEPEYVYDKHHGEAGYTCEFELINGKYYEECTKIDEETPEGWDKDFVRSGFSQAVVNKGPYAGSPLPTFTENKKSDVTFNYYDLSYEIKYTNNTFTDIKGHRFENEMIEAANRLIIKGYGDGTFGPNRDITRAEFATMVVRTLGLIPSGSARFTDVPSNAWYYEFVNTAAEWGIVVGIGNDLFAPERNITRQEAAVMLMRAAKILEENDFEADRKQLYEVEFYGWEDSAMWARTEVIESVLYGVMDLRDNHQFKPLENITRAETASAMLNLLKNYELINK